MLSEYPKVRAELGGGAQHGDFVLVTEPDVNQLRPEAD
jgi:hypothetical protein